MTINDKEYLTPPDNEAIKAHVCCSCSEYIYEGEEYFNIYGDIFCVDCAESQFLEIAR